MNIKKIGIDNNQETKYATYDELKRNNVVAQGWSAFGDLTFAYVAKDETCEGDFNYFIEEKCTVDTKAPYTFRQLLRDIRTGDIILAFQGRTLKGITEMPSEFIYYYNDNMKEYKNCLYPVRWVDWNDFCENKNLKDYKTSAPYGIQGIENSGVKEINSYIEKHWKKFKEETQLEIQPIECQEKLKDLIRNFDKNKQESRNAFFQEIINKNNKVMIDNCKKLLETKKNLILQGAPGTGKTYITHPLALSIIEDNDDVDEKEQIGFVTFHQSMDYDDFIEGIRTEITEDGQIVYRPRLGIFREMCTKAKENPQKKYVLIIDEINRGNVSKIFGELISLIEPDKRESLTATLPYSKDEFSVPKNLYIIGTMNTTDRSVGSLDYAIRRRFAFYTLLSRREIVESSYSSDEEKVQALALFDAVRSYIDKNKTDMDVDDLMVGHSYFMYKDKEDLDMKWKYAILPLIQEYYKDGICSKAPEKDMGKFIEQYK